MQRLILGHWIGTSTDLGSEKMWPRRHRTNRPWQNAQQNWSHLTTKASDKWAKRGITDLRSDEQEAHEGAESHVSVAERDGPCFVEGDLERKRTLGLLSWESDPLPLDHKHLTWGADSIPSDCLDKRRMEEANGRHTIV